MMGEGNNKREEELVEVELEVTLGSKQGGGIEVSNLTIPFPNSIVEVQPEDQPYGFLHSKSDRWKLRSSLRSSWNKNMRRFSVSGNNASNASLQLGEAPRTVGHRKRPTKLTRSKSAAQKALHNIRFVTKTSDGNTNPEDAWCEVEKRFFDLASPDGLLARADFAKCIGMRDSVEFAEELFDALGRRRGRREVQSITKNELHEYYYELIDQQFDNRLKLFFEMFDTDADGHITEDEVKELIMLSASANRLAKLKEQAEEYAALIMEELDPDNLGYIEAWQLESLLLQAPSNQNPGHLYKSQSLNYSQALSQNLITPPRRNPIVRFTRKVKSMVLENWKRIWIITLWILVMAGLFAYKFYQYKHRNAFQVMGYCVCAAKGAAETLKLNMALILFPVCRNTITWLRNTKIGLIVPFDDNINFHKTIALGIIAGTVIHGGVHLVCDFPRIINAPEEKYALIAGDFGGKRPTYGFFVASIEGVTGVIMVVLMIVAFTLATTWFRRNLVKFPKPFHKISGFNAFWYTHHTFVIVYICLIIHGVCLFLSHKWYQKTTWMYLAVPVLLYLGERTLRAIRSGHHGVDILKVAIYPGDVLSLHMSKPQGFKFVSGQYIFMKCPDISPFEWHPFSITSAPDDDYLSVHIRTSGDWTQELRRLFSECCAAPMGGKSGLLRADLEEQEGDTKFPTILIDGPYGAPAQHHMKYDIMLLIGLGIGATPFISILKNTLNHMKHPRSSSSSPDFFAEQANMSRPKEAVSTSHAYLFWVTREQGSFEWFRGVMNEVAEYDNKGAIELHNYLTSVYEEGDARSALITMIQALHHAKHGVDILSGTKVKTHLGRPDWRKVFSRMAANHKGAKIGVFYCGAPVLGRELKKLAHEYNRKHGINNTRFDFYKENF